MQAAVWRDLGALLAKPDDNPGRKTPDSRPSSKATGIKPAKVGRLDGAVNQKGVAK